MEKVLVVAKTHMDRFHACVGGLRLQTSDNIRLLLPGGDYPPIETPFKVGQVWNMNLSPVRSTIPPHRENTIVINKVHAGQIPDLRTTLLQHIQPWEGGLSHLTNHGNQSYPSPIKIPYVGFDAPLSRIPSNTLVRVSLARWWRRPGDEEEKCHLQISGWCL